jgi:hypothetical protein
MAMVKDVRGKAVNDDQSQLLFVGKSSDSEREGASKDSLA